MILFFSATGNCKYVATRIVQSISRMLEVENRVNLQLHMTPESTENQEITRVIC